MIGIPDSPSQAYAFGLKILGENYELKDNIERLNREIASWKSEISKLNQTIKDLKKAGSLDESEINQFLTETLEGKHPRERVTHQRKEINNLHRVIRELKDEIERLREG